MKLSHLYILLIVIFLCSAFTSEPVRENNLYEKFRNPSAEARPFVRWWWGGNFLDENELKREVDLLHEAGFGGVEINPLSGRSLADTKGLKQYYYCSPEWCQLVERTAKYVQGKGMIADMILGAGWPFSRENLDSMVQVKGVKLQTIELNGPLLFEKNILGWVELNNRRAQSYSLLKTKIMFLSLIPDKASSFADCIDLLPLIDSKNNVRVQVPTGKFTVYLGTIQVGTSFKTNEDGVPGSAGPCLDHFNTLAVSDFLNWIADSFNQATGKNLGQFLRAVFVDSIELGRANWTNDFKELFKKEYGYDITPYLPFLFPINYNLNESSAFADNVKRARFDFNQLLVNRFRDSFVQNIQEWSRKQGVLFRYQAYGEPYSYGEQEGAALVDIPESEEWLMEAPLKDGCFLSKMVGSAGNMTGKKIHSSESFTNVTTVFKTTLEDLKVLNDMQFATGVNHNIVHGFNFSPKDAPFPGWVKFGTYFSEHNTWWKHLQLWTDYSARISALMQSTDPVPDIAILTPMTDKWAQEGLSSSFGTNFWDSSSVWKTFQRYGFQVDYLTEGILKTVGTHINRNGQFVCGKMAYRTILVADNQSMSVFTVQLLAEFVKAGGKLIIIGRWPSRTPGMVNAQANDNQLKKIISQLKENPRVAQVPSPVSAKENSGWVRQLIINQNLQPIVKIKNPANEVYMIEKTKESQKVFFFTNQDRKGVATFVAEFNTGNMTPWIWNPEDGSRKVFPYTNEKNKLSISIPPSGSLILVFENRGGMPEKPDIRLDSFRIETPWEVYFKHSQEPITFKRTWRQLMEFTQSDDRSIANFAGDVSYKTTFSLAKTCYSKIAVGQVHGVAEVYLNGKCIGKTWYGNHELSIDNKILKIGENQLEIKYTTVLWNYCRTLTNNQAVMYWIRWKDWTEQGEIRAPFPQGVSGPLLLY